jgi:hypothetical protein
MRICTRIGRALLLLMGLATMMSACVVEPREGYWDHDHNRWYHNHSWVSCGERDEHCH